MNRNTQDIKYKIFCMGTRSERTTVGMYVLWRDILGLTSRRHRTAASSCLSVCSSIHPSVHMEQLGSH